MSQVSLDDIMEFMRKEKEERAKEREADKLDIKNMIIKGVKEEVQNNIKPLQDKQEKLESAQADIKEKFGELFQMVKDLEFKVEAPNISAEVAPRPLNKTSLANDQVTKSPNEEVPRSEDIDPRVAEIIDMARRTVGLCSIDSNELARMRSAQYGGATTEEEEKQYAVREYLRCELKISDEIADEMEIESIFVPVSEKDDPRSLNVTFKDYSSVIKIYEKTRIMRKDSRITNYVPRQFNDTLKAISAIDFNMRQDKQIQTRIKMGLRGLELHKKLRGSRKWERVALPNNLPPVNLSSRPASESSSPPPGRPRLESCREKRGRGSSGSDSDSEKHLSKAARKDLEKADVDEEQEEKDHPDPGSPVTGQHKNVCHDPGSITSIQGTPSKSLSNLAMQSPILSRSKYSRK